MPSYRYNGRKGRQRSLVVSSKYVVVRTRDRRPLEPRRLAKGSLEALQDLEPVLRFEAAGVEVHRVRARRGQQAARDRVRRALKQDSTIEFAGRVLCQGRSSVPVLYTENLFVKFLEHRGERACRRVIRAHGLEVKRPIPYLENGFFLGAPEGCGMEVFAAAERLLQEETVEYCHPELIKQAQRRAIFPDQWHLARTTIGGLVVNAHVNVEPAWQVTQGEGVTIAVIDDGFDLEHEEFASAGKIVSPLDVTADSDNPRPGASDNHGTACAGVACADGLHRASGVAPKADLMPIRLKSGLGSQDEADALQLAAENGADVISCSWGPEDGDWQNAQDPRHGVSHPLPDSTRLAIDWAVENGRGGRGCVVTWAAGNGNESVDKDGYASYGKVLAVAACSDQGKRSVYSDFGDAIWCCFPSDDFAPTARTRGIWTTDRSGAAGYNPGRSKLGDREGRYTNRFGGTSSACPGVAGVAALMLAANPTLTWEEARLRLRDSCDRIDPDEGAYDDRGHSVFYGYGRVNAARAVSTVAPPAAPGSKARTARPVGDPRTLPRPPVRHKAELTVELATSAAEFSVRIDDRPLSFEDGVAHTVVSLEERCVLAWWIRGEAGAPYRIALSAAGPAIRGRLPVRGAIGRGRTKSGGTRMFSLTRSED